MKRIIIFGAGGFGRETAQLIEDINLKKEDWVIEGFVDDAPELKNKIVNGYKVLGGAEYLNNYTDEVFITCPIGYANVKKKVIDKVSNSNVVFANLIHPSAIISGTVELGQGIIIQSNCVVTTNVRLGNHVHVNPQCGIAHDSIIGDYTSLFWNVNVSGNVKIGEGCVLGSKSVIIQGKSIGNWSTIGSGSNVINDIPSNCTAVGNPAKPIKYNLGAL